MKKRELLALPEMKVTKKMKEAVREDKGSMRERWSYAPIWAPKYTWYYRAKQTKKVLEIAIYTREGVERECASYRVFLHDGKYDTYDMRTKKWRKSTIERLEYREDVEYYWYSEKGVWISQKEKETILKYTDNEIKDPRAAVQRWQNYKKNRSEIDKIDAKMRLVPELPKDFNEWILTDGLPQYIFYNAGRKVEEGYCTACKNTVKIEKPKYNQETTCPRCKRKVIYKSRKKSGNIVDWKSVGIIQKTEEGFVYRYFKARAKYKNGVRIEDNYWEEIRKLYNKEFRKGDEFEFYRYKQTDMIRWCYKTYGYYENVREYPAILYWRNLKRITKGTEMQYSAIDIFARKKELFYPEDYIIAYKRFKGIEQLVKCGFYNIARGVIRRQKGASKYLKPSLPAVTKVLGLRKDYYKLLAGTDPTIKEYEVAKELQDTGIWATREEVRYLGEYGGGRNFVKYIRYTTPHKMLRYLKERLKSNKELIREYHDCLEMAAELGHDLNEEYELFPKKILERHYALVEERKEKEDMIKRMEDAEKVQEYKKTVKRQGLKYYEMESGDLLIRVPKDPAEIRKEGNILHHCVATYIDRAVGGTTTILFIREKNDPDKPFYTMEVRNGEIIQCRGKYNQEMTEAVKEFVGVFKRKKLNTMERRAG